MATDKALLKEVTQELWQTVKKLRPDIDKDARLQLVLKALITIGDLPNHIEAAVVVGICAEMEEDPSKTDIEGNASTSKKSKLDDMPEGRRVVRRRSAAS